MMISVVGFFAAILTTASFVPQAIQTIRTKNTKGISLLMYAMFSVGVLAWLIYGIANRDVPVLIANAITLCFALVILIFKIKYK